MNSVSQYTPITKAGTGPTQCSASMRMSHLPLPLHITSQHSPSALIVNAQTGSEDYCLQPVIPPATVKHNAGEEISCRVREQEYHLGTLKAKLSRTCWELGEEIYALLYEMGCSRGNKLGKEISAGGQVAAVRLMAMSPISREHCCLHWVTRFRRSSCSSFKQCIIPRSSSHDSSSLLLKTQLPYYFAK